MVDALDVSLLAGLAEGFGVEAGSDDAVAGCGGTDGDAAAAGCAGMASFVGCALVASAGAGAVTLFFELDAWREAFAGFSCLSAFSPCTRDSVVTVVSVLVALRAVGTLVLSVLASLIVVGELAARLVSARFVSGFAIFAVRAGFAITSCEEPTVWLSTTAPPMTAAVMTPNAMPKWFTFFSSSLGSALEARTGPGFGGGVKNRRMPTRSSRLRGRAHCAPERKRSRSGVVRGSYYRHSKRLTSCLLGITLVLPISTRTHMPPNATTLKIPDSLKERLAVLAAAEGKSPHAYMIEALERQAERAERQRAYLAAGDAALREYERTGIAFAMEDVERYIVALAEGRQAAKPKPVKRAKKAA